MKLLARLSIVTLTVLPTLTLVEPVSAVVTTTTFTLQTSSTIGLMGVDATYTNSNPDGYEKMVRWSSDGRLWEYDQVLGSPTYGWRTGQTNGVTVAGSPRLIRLEFYPHPTTTCSGTNENDSCYWLTYDPWTSTRGGTHVQVESTQGTDWLNIGTVRLPTLGIDGAFRMDGNIVSGTSVSDGRVSVDIFQIDCSWHETCAHPPINERGNELGTFASSTNRGSRWTGGVAWPGHYIFYVRDNARDIHLHGLVDVDANNIPTIDLDSPCFGLDTCVMDRGTVPPATGGFHPTDPVRILDTRKGWGIANGMLRFGDGSQTSTNPLLRADDTANHDLKVLGVGGIPSSGVSAVLLNVTAISPATNGFITVGPRPAGTGDLLNDQHSYGPWPNTSNLNVRSGQTAPNLVLARVGAGGRIRLYNYGYPLHMVADVAGWFDTGSTATSGGLGLTGLNPTRVLDTRNGIGGAAGANRFAAGDDRAIMIRGVAGVPANAQSVIVNITAVEPSGSGYVTAYPSGTSLPDASNLNLIRGQDRPNLAVVKIGADGAIRLSVSETSTHLLVDVQGYYAPAVNGARRTIAIDPVRIFDTRNGIGTSGGRMGPGETRTVQVAGSSGMAGIPANATAVYVNITSVAASAWGWLAVWPTGNLRPDVSNVNWPGGTDIPNMALVGLGTNGTLQLYNDAAVSGSTSTHVLIDVMGYVV
ncbi:MAG: hypothetical protein ACO29A_02400 [Ilumatobacteraceae bacterium]